MSEITYGPGIDDYGRLKSFRYDVEEPIRGKCKQSIYIEELYPETKICSRCIHPTPCEGTREDRKWCSFMQGGKQDDE